MRRFVMMVSMTLACVGCASRKITYWYHPDRTLEEARKDCRECNRQAQARANEEHVRRYRDSMEHDRPWQMGVEPVEEANRELDELNAFEACMKSRGYRRHQAFPLDATVRTAEEFGADRIQHLAGR